MSNFEKKSGMGEGGVEAKHPLAPPPPGLTPMLKVTSGWIVYFLPKLIHLKMSAHSEKDLLPWF